MAALAQVISLPARVDIDALKFDSVTMKDAVRRIVRMARRHDRARHVCTATVDDLVRAEHDAELKSVYRKADLVVAAGAPVVWLSRLAAGSVLPERVAATDLLWELAKASSETNVRLFLLGGMTGAAAKAARVIEKRYPGARVAGTYCPPGDGFDDAGAEKARIKRIVKQAAPDILLVSRDAANQEKWIAANKDALGVPVTIGVGAAFEIAAGFFPRAPLWMQSAGLEWLHRLAQHPDLLFRRYVYEDLPYLAGAALRAIAHRFETPALPR